VVVRIDWEEIVINDFLNYAGENTFQHNLFGTLMLLLPSLSHRYGSN
jgi:hypothetical protein